MKNLQCFTLRIATIALLILGNSMAVEVFADQNSTINRSAFFPTFDILEENTSIQVHAIGDVDGDGDLDLFAAGTSSVKWYENNDGDETSFLSHDIETFTDSYTINQILACDVDGDSDLDVMVAGTLGIVWLENPGSLDTDGTWLQHVVAIPNLDTAPIALGDIDGDGDHDVVGGDLFVGGATWWENCVSEDSSWLEHPVSVIGMDYDYTLRGLVTIADFDGDGDLDLLIPQTDIALDRKQLIVLENFAGDGSTWRDIHSELGTSLGGVAADIDQDGSLEVLTVTGLVWWKSSPYAIPTSCPDGTGSITEPCWYLAWNQMTNPLINRTAENVKVVDIDEDGDLDIVYTLIGDVHWLENQDSNPYSYFNWIDHQIPMDSFYKVSDVNVGDLDNDGQLDLIATSTETLNNDAPLVLLASPTAMTSPDSGIISWWKNRGGQVALETYDLGPLEIGVCKAGSYPVLDIDAYHRGRLGDNNAELTSLAFRFDDKTGTQLTSEQVRSLIDSVSIYAGNSAESSWLTTVTDLTLLDGVLIVDLPAGLPEVTLAAPTSNTGSPPQAYFAEVATRHVPSTQELNQLRITHLTESGSLARDVVSNMPLTIEYYPETSTTVAIAPDMPPVAEPKNIYLYVGAILNPYDVIPFGIGIPSADDCGKYIASVSPNTFSCKDLGENSYTLTITDVAGSTAVGTATVNVKNDGSCSVDSDGDGVPDYLDNCETPLGVTQVDEFGCLLDSDGDGVPDYLDNCPNDPDKILPMVCGCGVSEGCDISPPSIDLIVTPEVLWPPNHKHVSIAVDLTVLDDSDDNPVVKLVSITMNEGDQTNTFDASYDYTIEDGKKSGDIWVDTDGTIWLRAERSGTGDGRIYTLTYEAIDASGNTATITGTVVVPHNL